MNRLGFTILTAWIIISLSGCSIQPQLPFTYGGDFPAETVLPDDLEARLIQYWTFRSTGNLEDAYKMEAPYTRELISLPIYNKLFSKGSAIEKIEIVGVEQVSNRYFEIVIKTFLRMDDKSTKESFQKDNWVKPGKVWTHVKKDPILINYFP